MRNVGLLLKRFKSLDIIKDTLEKVKHVMNVNDTTVKNLQQNDHNFLKFLINRIVGDTTEHLDHSEYLVINNKNAIY